jgi:hypothetical protein
MANDPRHQRALSPDEVAAEVAAILTAAERDARATIEAARRRPELSSATRSDRADRQPGAGAPPAGGNDGRVPGVLAELTQAVASLTSRVEAVETALTGRSEAASEGPPSPPFPAWERAKSPAVTGGADGGRAQRVRAVDLALRGFSRAQIAAELRASLSEPEVERLLDEVLERT